MATAESTFITSLLILAGCIGATAFAIGVVAARRWWDGRKVEALPASHTALNLLLDVCHRTDHISRELIEYRELLSGLAKRVDTADTTDSARDLLSQFIELNRYLQRRLEDSERELHQQSEQLAIYVSEARVDALSGLPNRRAFEDEFDRQLAYWRRHEHPFSMLMIDIDHFKSINDRFGHPTGDQVLQAVSRALTSTLRTSDFVCRFGGEEFAAVLRGTDLEMAIRAGQRCCEAIRNCEVVHQGERISVTISCGVATAQAGDDQQGILERADQALYRAKASGRDMVCVHDGFSILPAQPVAAAS